MNTIMNDNPSHSFNIDPITSIGPKHFIQWITERSSIFPTAFHLTFVYKKADTPAEANIRLRQTLPYFFRKAIASRWTRSRYDNSFELIAFLDEPGTRRNSAPVHNVHQVQDNYHHHCILLAKSFLAKRISTRLALNADIGEKVITFPNAPTRSVHVAQITHDLYHVTSYAAKGTEKFAYRAPDEYLQCFTNKDALTFC